MVAKVLEAWNGTSLSWEFDPKSPDVVVTSEASGNWGCGAYVGAQWFMYQWPAEVVQHHTMIKELIPIVMARAIWGKQWPRCTVLAWCDNASVVAVINGGYSWDAIVMHLLRCLFFLSSIYSFQLYARHIPGSHNELADALSRNRLPLFQAQYPGAAAQPTPIPEAVVDLLMKGQPDWLLPDWSRLFAFICNTP